MATTDALIEQRKRMDATEHAMLADIWRSVPPDVARSGGFEMRSFGPVQVLVATGLRDVPMMNLVLGATEPGAVADGHLHAAVEWITSLGVRHYVPVTPDLPGADLARRWLLDNGFEPGYGWMKFTRDATSPEPDPAGATVTEIGAGEGAEFSRILATGFGMPSWAHRFAVGVPGLPGWRCYVAMIDGVPSACAAMRIHDGAAEFGLAATLPEARGRGCQTILLNRRIRDAAEAGCDLLFVETGERTDDRPSGSYRNILRAGFTESYLRPNYQKRTA